MNIATYLKEKSLRASDLARASGINPCVLTHHLRRGRKISPYIAKKLEEGTNGELKAVDLVFGEDSASSPKPGGNEAC